jgi:hypothetical protein
VLSGLAVTTLHPPLDAMLCSAFKIKMEPSSASVLGQKAEGFSFCFASGRKSFQIFRKRAQKRKSVKRLPLLDWCHGSQAVSGQMRVWRKNGVAEPNDLVCQAFIWTQNFLVILLFISGLRTKQRLNRSRHQSCRQCADPFSLTNLERPRNRRHAACGRPRYSK